MTTRMMTMVTKSKNYDIVKEHYDDGFWSLKKVRNAVKAKWITPEEFFEITGVEYE